MMRSRTKKIIIVAVVAVVVTGLVMSGFVHLEDSLHGIRHQAAIWGSWIAGFFSAKPPIHNVNEAKACRTMLRFIESAKRRLAQKQHKTVGNVSWDAVLKEINMKTMPECPSGGEYILGELVRYHDVQLVQIKPSRRKTITASKTTEDANSLLR